MKRIALALCILSMVMVADAQGSYVLPAQVGFSVQDWLAGYLSADKQEAPEALTLEEHAVVYSLDLLLSLLCLWGTVWLLTKSNLFVFKRYFWFFVALNLAWAAVMSLLRAGWEVLDFLVIRLEPSLRPVCVHYFFFAMVILALVLFIWLLARTFSLGFFNAIKVCLMSNIAYFVILGLISFFLRVEAPLVWLVKDHLGLGASVSNYARDVGKITAKEPLASLMRLRLYHL
jgi:hypothetical protein